MTLKTREEYLDSMDERRHKVYINGKKLEKLADNPCTLSMLESNGKIYDLALEPEHEEVMCAVSSLTGEKVNRNLHISASVEDLEKRAEMALLAARKLGTCNYRCVGCDVLNALASVTWEIDQQEGTEYNKRFIEYVRQAQELDLAISGAVTDAKGDRRKKILEEDPDMYVHISEKRSDGIVVRGAKLHQSGAFASHETLVIPGGFIRPGEEKFAVAFAVDNRSKGITFINQYNPLSAERDQAGDIWELGNPIYGQRETCMMIFEDVFIPYERVFLMGETKYTGKLIAGFAKIHRMNCGGACKVGFADIIIGASKLASEYAGTEKVPHIREMLTDMIRISETARACTLAAALKGKEEPAGSGVFMPDEIFGNVSKINIADGFWQLMAYAGDIAGGLIVTMPSLQELKNPATKPYLEKYLRAAAPAEERMRITKVLQNWAAGLHGPGTWHGAGSPQTQKVSLYRAVDMDDKVSVAKEIAGIGG